LGANQYLAGDTEGFTDRLKYHNLIKKVNEIKVQEEAKNYIFKHN